MCGRSGQPQGTLKSHGGDKKTIAQALGVAGSFGKMLTKEGSTFFHSVVRRLLGYKPISLVKRWLK